ncbi:MAG: phytase [Lysobacteraceae bacterium]
MTPHKALLAALLPFSLLAGCATAPDAKPDANPDVSEYAPEPDQGKDDDVTTARSGVKYTLVPEAFVSALTPDHNVDSPASWRAPGGATLLFATAKATDRVLVYDGDTGAFLHAAAGSGKALGQLDRPNGIFAIDDLLFVVERDNHRVQVFALPQVTPLGVFGADDLIQPYGLWLRQRDAGYEVLVSDAYMSEADEDVPPPLADLGRRFKRYAVMVRDGALHAELLGTFGDTNAKGAILIPESLWGDAANGRMLLSEEEQSGGTRLKLYGPDFHYADQDIGSGLFRAQAEGIALWQCPDGSGYWIATDQYTDKSVFHVFERENFEHLGAFAGRTTANTDGVWLNQAPTNAFPAGVFYAVHDDQAVAAFDWRDIARALELKQDCAVR